MHDQDFRHPCRAFLQALTCLTAGIALSLLSLPAQPQELNSQWLAEKTLFIQGPDANVLAVDSSEGLILVDGGHADWYEALRQKLEQHFPARPIRALINTHWHPEQTGANLALGSEGVEIIAHENTMLWLSTEIQPRGSAKPIPPLPAQARPGTLLYEFGDNSLQLGDQVIHYGYLMNAHTDGDIWLYLADQDILVTGGLVSHGQWPELDWWTGGYIGAMLDSFTSLLSVPGPQTQIVPAQGPLMDLQALQAQNQMYLTLFDRLHGAFIQSHSLEEVLAADLAADFESDMGDSTRFMTQAYQSLLGRLRDPQNFRMLNFP